mmetsp:Transcript_18266/g.60224  ORF Transcript_18266/g.60224 Transcript_18266/m.60224 type:complete len:270 (+) Transcript_18266:66-875(+)
MNARDLLSGACGGGLAVLISQPIDVVRVQLQTMPGSSSAVATARTLVQQRGILSLWRGTTPPLLGAGLLMSVFRTTQQSTSRVFGEDGSFVKFAAAGAIGGLAQAPLAVPVEHLKVRLQVCQAQWCSCGIVPLARHIVSVAGVGALWRGWAPTVMRDVIGFGLFFGCTDYVLARTSPTGRRGDASFVASFAAGCGLFFCVFPLDVIKVRLQGDSLLKPAYTGVLDCLRQTVRAGGVGTLFNGFALTAIGFATPKNGAKLLGFDLVSRCL